jgi:hypothetical protein
VGPRTGLEVAAMGKTSPLHGIELSDRPAHSLATKLRRGDYEMVIVDRELMVSTER